VQEGALRPLGADHPVCGPRLVAPNRATFSWPTAMVEPCQPR
jgi:hypothetical protein